MVVRTVGFRAPRKKMRPNEFLPVCERVHFINNGLEITLDVRTTGWGRVMGLVLVVVGEVGFEAAQKIMHLSTKEFFAFVELIFSKRFETTLDMGTTGRGMGRGFVFVVVGTVDFRAPRQRMRPTASTAVAEYFFYVEAPHKIMQFFTIKFLAFAELTFSKRFETTPGVGMTG